MIRTGIVIVMIAAANTSAQDAVRYEFEIRLSENTLAADSGNPIASLAVGTVGSFTIDVLNDPEAYPSQNSGIEQEYPVYNFFLTIASLTLNPQPSSHPGQASRRLMICNDSNLYVSSEITDALFFSPNFSDAGFVGSATFLQIAQILPVGSTPTLFSSVDLPLNIDPSLAPWYQLSITESLFENAIFSIDSVDIIPFTPCFADVNGDGSVTPTDFTAWINAFNSGASQCDQNGDVFCDPTDFTAWIANFNAGC